ncbi:hypothetical protein [Pseudomonas putida]|uniref:hypothetical protein n=1 Tax=Pseudomonas putida TaxID=303 RepID=UPI003D9767A0
MVVSGSNISSFSAQAFNSAGAYERSVFQLVSKLGTVKQGLSKLRLQLNDPKLSISQKQAAVEKIPSQFSRMSECLVEIHAHNSHPKPSNLTSNSVSINNLYYASKEGFADAEEALWDEYTELATSHNVFISEVGADLVGARSRDKFNGRSVSFAPDTERE